MIQKFAGNSIADEMFRLLKKASYEKYPEVNEVDNDPAAMMEGMSDDADYAEDNLKDYLTMNNDDADDDVSYVDNEIDTMQSHSAQDYLMRGHATEEQEKQKDNMIASASDRHLMSGLGKIEASLRRKGEGFAADLVRTTALSIQGDIVKEASKKTFVIKNLVKMASDLDRRGQRKAASVVKMTIEKINR
jgi:hypothetical protein